ncbi:hypothetical protein QQ045_020394 [Rhodiola kirilowii]
MDFKQELDYLLKRKRAYSAGEDRDLTANTSPTIHHGTSSASEIVNLDDLPWDPAERKKITQYHPNQLDEVRQKFLLQQGLPFRGHDESEESNNQGKFMELNNYTGNQNETANKVVLKKAPRNNQMISPTIQKDNVRCFSQEVIFRIIEAFDNDVFALLVDESSDVSYKEQMVVILRFVDKSGTVKERFIGVIHVKDTSSASLKNAIDSLFSEHGLSLKSVRGQGYDGASNIKGLTESLSMALQRKDQDIMNAMSMVTSTKLQLQTIRDHDWNSLMQKVSSFCDKYDIQILNLEEEFVDARRPRRKSGRTNMQHLQVDCLYTVLDLILQQFNDRFNEINYELLICMASLSPIDLFQHFYHLKLMRLMKFYPDDFDFGDQNLMEHQLRLYIDNVREVERF